MRIYRHKARRDGVVQESARWYADVRLPGGKRTPLPLFEPQKISQDFADKLGTMIDQYNSGGSYDKHVQLWLGQVSLSMLKRFAKWGLVETAKASAGSPLADQLADFKAHIIASGASTKQADQQCSRVKRVFDEAGFTRLSDIVVGRTLNTIGKLTVIVAGCGQSKDTGRAVSSMTKRHHVRACKQFTRWLRNDGRVDINPLETLAIKGAKVENHRRALTADEATYLLDFVSRAEESFKMNGAERSLVYRLALESGLRRNELITLKRSSFDFKRCTVKIDAEHSKTRKAATQPVRAATMGIIEAHLSAKLPTAPAFGLTANHSARMLQKDMDAARAAWVAEAKDNPKEHRQRTESDFMKVVTHAGKIDFHALRHSFATFLVQSGVDIKSAQQLLRHTTPAMTLGLYVHARDEKLVSAVDALPSFEVQKKKSKKA